MAAPGLVDSLADALGSSGTELRSWAIAWARLVPTLALVPAFGLRAVPAPARAALGLALAVGFAPAVRPLAAGQPWAVQLVVELGRGLPVAIVAAVALWAASMAGGLVDNLRASRETASLPVVEAGSTPTGTLLALLVAIAFLQSGGPARVASALAAPGAELSGPLARAVGDLVGGIELAIAVAAPIVVASIVLEVAGALVARAASPAFIQPLLAPIRSVAILGVAALLLDRMARLLVLYAAQSP